MAKYWLLSILFSVPAFASAQPVCTKSTINLHKLPNSSSPVTWRVARWTPLLRTEKKKGWSKVQDLEGDVHWAKSSDLTTTFRCVVVKTNTATIHKEPNRASISQDLKTLDRYTPLKRIGEQQSEWIRVENEAGHQAWIHESVVWKPAIVNSFTF
jgi:SH3-like domain-containing protein